MWKINKKEIKIRRGREVQQKIQKSISGGGGGGGEDYYLELESMLYQDIRTRLYGITNILNVRCGGGSKTAATSKIEHFVIIVNELHLGCCSSPL